MKLKNIPFLLLRHHANDTLSEAVTLDLDDAIAGAEGAVVEEVPDEGEAIFVSNGMLNPSPELFHFMLDGLEDFDLIIQPSLEAKVLAVAVDLQSENVSSVIEAIHGNEVRGLLELMRMIHDQGLEATVLPPWYGLIDGDSGKRFAYQHIAAQELQADGDGFGLRTLRWLKEEGFDA